MTTTPNHSMAQGLLNYLDQGLPEPLSKRINGQVLPYMDEAKKLVVDAGCAVDVEAATIGLNFSDLVMSLGCNGLPFKKNLWVEFPSDGEISRVAAIARKTPEHGGFIFSYLIEYIAKNNIPIKNLHPAMSYNKLLASTSVDFSKAQQTSAPEFFEGLLNHAIKTAENTLRSRRARGCHILYFDSSQPNNINVFPINEGVRFYVVNGPEVMVSPTKGAIVNATALKRYEKEFNAIIENFGRNSFLTFDAFINSLRAVATMLARLFVVMNGCEYTGENRYDLKTPSPSGCIKNEKSNKHRKGQSNNGGSSQRLSCQPPVVKHIKFDPDQIKLITGLNPADQREALKLSPYILGEPGETMAQSLCRAHAVCGENDVVDPHFLDKRYFDFLYRVPHGSIGQTGIDEIIRSLHDRTAQSLKSIIRDYIQRGLTSAEVWVETPQFLPNEFHFRKNNEPPVRFGARIATEPDGFKFDYFIECVTLCDPVDNGPQEICLLPIKNYKPVYIPITGGRVYLTGDLGSDATCALRFVHNTQYLQEMLGLSDDSVYLKGFIKCEALVREICGQILNVALKNPELFKPLTRRNAVDRSAVSLQSDQDNPGDADQFVNTRIFRKAMVDLLSPGSKFMPDMDEDGRRRHLLKCMTQWDGAKEYSRQIVREEFVNAGVEIAARMKNDHGYDDLSDIERIKIDKLIHEEGVLWRKKRLRELIDPAVREIFGDGFSALVTYVRGSEKQNTYGTHYTQSDYFWIDLTVRQSPAQEQFMVRSFTINADGQNNGGASRLKVTCDRPEVVIVDQGKKQRFEPRVA